MPENKTKPNKLSVADYLNTFELKRQEEALTLIRMFKDLTDEEPVMWGDAIIGFGNMIGFILENQFTKRTFMK